MCPGRLGSRTASSGAGDVACRGARGTIPERVKGYMPAGTLGFEAFGEVERVAVVSEEA